MDIQPPPEGPPLRPDEYPPMLIVRLMLSHGGDDVHNGLAIQSFSFAIQSFSLNICNKQGLRWLHTAMPVDILAYRMSSSVLRPIVQILFHKRNRVKGQHAGYRQGLPMRT